MERTRELRFVWPSFPRASGYRLELFRGGTRILTADVDQPVFSLPHTWIDRGRAVTLGPGEYRVYVWAVVAGRYVREPVIQATLVAPRR
ncbi:MAG TPA: hypothetical protein VNJ46_03820 [Gaiellaceae bacterium]|nr:hypothetical protein [Gaiellaceae bacterium]